MRAGGRERSGIYLESTEDEQLGVLPHQCTRVKDAMTRSVSVVTPLTEIAEAVQLMKSLDIGALLVCNGSTLVGTLCDRDIAMANAPPSAAIQEVMTYSLAYCIETDLLIDAEDMMRAQELTALPVRDSSGLLSGIVMKAIGTTAIGFFVVPLILGCGHSVAWSADVTPVPPPPLESRPNNPQGPTVPPPSRIDPVLNGALRRFLILVRQLFPPLSIPRCQSILKRFLLPRGNRSLTALRNPQASLRLVDWH
jgi:predicted transcriptional regulator